MSKMIGIKIPEDSNLQERLKYLSFTKKKQYWELLEKWLSAEEHEATPGQIQIAFPSQAGDAPSNHRDNELSDVRAEIKKVDERVSSIYDRIAEFEKQFLALAVPTPRAEKITEPADIARLAVIDKIVNLRLEGVSLQKIADQLNADLVPTFSGSGAWSSGTISKIIKKSESK